MNNKTSLNTRLLLSILFKTNSCGLIRFDEGLHPSCNSSTEFRFNLIDSLNRDIVFDDSALFKSEDIKIKDSAKIEYHLNEGESFSNNHYFNVFLDGRVKQYYIFIKSTLLDTINVEFKKTKERCCGETYWIEKIEFEVLETKPKNPDLGSTPVLVN